MPHEDGHYQYGSPERVQNSAFSERAELYEDDDEMTDRAASSGGWMAREAAGGAKGESRVNGERTSDSNTAEVRGSRGRNAAVRNASHDVLDDDNSATCCGAVFKGGTKFIVGILILVTVDIIWVASAAATKYLYDDDNYQKPLFTLYFKTSLFILYLPAILVIPSWRALARGKSWRPADEEDELSSEDESLDDNGIGANDTDNLLSNALAVSEDMTDIEEDDELPDAFDAESADDSSLESPAMAAAPSFPARGRKGGDSPYRTEIRGRRTGAAIGLPPILMEVGEDGSLGGESMEEQDSTPKNSHLHRRASVDGGFVARRAHVNNFNKPLSRTVSLTSTASMASSGSVTSLKSCLKRGDSSTTSLVEVVPRPPVGKRPSLSSPHFSPMKVTKVRERGENDDLVVEEVPDGVGSSCVVKARRNSKVHFRVSQEIRVMPSEESNDARYARLSYESAETLRRKARAAAHRLNLKETAKLSFMFLFLWFIANYFYQLAFVKTSVATVNILSSTSSIFVLLLSAFLPSCSDDRFTLSKLLVVLVCCSGIALVGYSESSAKANNGDKGIAGDLGVLYSLLGSVFYALYVVILKRRVRNLDRLVVPIFFGFVGAWCIVLLWPMLFVFHYTGVERFQWPQDIVNGTRNGTHIWAVLAVNGVVGTVISEVLWLTGVFMTSPLVGTLALVLVSPLSLLYSILQKGLVVSPKYIAGSILVTLSFALAAILGSKNRDPIGHLIRSCLASCTATRRRRMGQLAFVNS